MTDFLATPPKLLVLPSGAPLPMPYRWCLEQGMKILHPWEHIDDQARALALRDEFLLETQAPNPSPVRDWLPFASYSPQDDFAGFVLVDGVPTGEVAVVHLTWRGRAEQPGWPSMGVRASFWVWLKEMIDEAEDWGERNGDDELAELASERADSQ